MRVVNSILIYIFLISFTYINYSCSNSKQCQPFEYKRFNIDTTNLSNNNVFASNGDSLNFVVKNFTIISKKLSNPSFSTIDECNNGYFVTYKCEKIDFTYNLYFIRKSSGYEFGTYSSFFNKSIQDVKVIDDIYFKISTNKNGSFIQYFSFKDGYLKSIIDCEGREWIRSLE